MAFWIGNQSIARLWYDNCFGYFCCCCCCCCIPFTKPHNHGDDSMVNASFMTSESTEVSVYHRPSLNAPLLKDDTKVDEKYIPSSSDSFNESRMQGSILSIFDFIVPKNNDGNDDNGTEEHSTESNNSNNSNGTKTNTTITGNLNVVQHSPNSAENEGLSHQNNGSGIIDV